MHIFLYVYIGIFLTRCLYLHTHASTLIFVLWCHAMFYDIILVHIHFAVFFSIWVSLQGVFMTLSNKNRGVYL